MGCINQRPRGFMMRHGIGWYNMIQVACNWGQFSLLWDNSSQELGTY